MIDTGIANPVDVASIVRTRVVEAMIKTADMTVPVVVPITVSWGPSKMEEKMVDNRTIFLDRRHLDATVSYCSCGRPFLYEIGVGPIPCWCGQPNPPLDVRAANEK